MVEKGVAVCQSHGFVLRDASGGVEVSRILQHGPKDLLKQDCLISIDGHNVSTSQDAMRRLEESVGSAQETVLEVSRGEGRVQEIVTVTMPCPQEKMAVSRNIGALDEKPSFSFYRKDKKDSKSDQPHGPCAPSPPPPAVPEAPPAPEPSEAEKEKALGNEAFKDSLWEDAIKHFTAAIDLSPQPVPNTYYSNRAAAYLQAGKAKEALVDAVKSTDGHPEFAKGHYRAGQALLELGRNHEAVAALNRARMSDPNNVQIYGALSRAQAALAAAKNAQEEREAEEAEKQQQVKLQQSQKPSVSGIKESAQAQSHADTNASSTPSSVAPSKAAQRNAPPSNTGKASAPKAATLWGGDGGALGGGAADEEAEKAKEEGNKAFAKGNFALAAENFTLAINLDPHNHVYYANRSAALLKMGKLEDALDDADRAIKLNRLYAKGHYRKGQALAVIGRVDLAVASMEEAVRLDPNNQSLQEALAGVKRMKAGIRGEGEELESNWVSDVALGQIECEVPKQGKAGDHVTLTINVPEYGPVKLDAVIPEGKRPGEKFMVDVGSPLELSKQKKEEGIRAYRGGRLQKAVTDFSDSLHLNPQDAACFANRSAANYSLGKLEEALADAEQCIKLQPKLHKGYLRKGLALAGVCDFRGAVEALQTAHGLCPEDEAVQVALKEAEADAASQERGEEVSRHRKEEDVRKNSKYVTQRTAAELEEKMGHQWERTEQKKKELAARAVEGAKDITNQMLYEEIRRAKAEDQHKEDTERAKFQAVRQGVEYDQFEQNVKGASLKPTRTKAGGNHGPGVLLHGQSGDAVPGLAKKLLNKEAGEDQVHSWLKGDDKKGDVPLCAAVSSLFAARAPAEEEALKLYLSNSKEFVRRWRALGPKTDERYRLLRALEPAKLAGIFRTEMETEVMTEIAENLAHALPRVCEILGSEEAGGAGGSDVDLHRDKEKRAAARHAMDLLWGITKLPRFELNARFLSKHEKQLVVTCAEWCIGADSARTERAGSVRKAFGCL